jgi:hypothetical protein
MRQDKLTALSSIPGPTGEHGPEGKPTSKYKIVSFLVEYVVSVEIDAVAFASSTAMALPPGGKWMDVEERPL